MEDSSFDRFAKTLAGGGSRRQLLRALAATGLVTALALPQGESEAREGSYDGTLGGRHGKNQRGRDHRNRDRGKQKRGDFPPPQSRPTGVCRPNGDVCAGNPPCCENLTCTASIIGIPSCQAACSSDEQCQRIYPNTQTGCLGDPFGCPFIAGGKCCTRVICVRDADCKSPFTCKGGLCRR